MRATIILLAITLLSSVVSPAEAGINIIDPDAYPPAGMDISNAYPGVPHATRFGFGTDTSVYAVKSSVDPTNMVFGRLENAAGDLTNKWGGLSSHSVFEVRFDTPVHSVSLDFIANDTSDFRPYLTAYKGTSGIIQIAHSTFIGPMIAGDMVTLTVSNPDPVITKIFASWDEVQYCHDGELDNLRFGDQVPEPSSIAIWALIGLTGGMLCYRRKRGAAA